MVLASRFWVGRRDARGARTPSTLLVLHLLTMLVSIGFRVQGASVAKDLRLVSVLFGALAGITALGGLVFRAALPRARIAVPQILQDVVIGACGLGTVLVVASRFGVNVAGIAATSAVITIVAGLALQETLGNIVGGLALQTDDSIRVGDWVKVGDISGRIAQIRWRYTAIETRNWETVVVPNSVLLKSQVTVFGRREGQPLKWRRWIYFNVDTRTPPPDVVAAVEASITGSPILNVASDPAPNVLVMDFSESWVRYAARYWLTDFAADDPTDHLVRQRIYFALKRAEIPLAMPAHAVFVTEDTNERREQKRAAESERRLSTIRSIDLFEQLTEDDQRKLAAGLRYAPFARGEVLTRQGAKAHWLYFIQEGSCSVSVGVGDVSREVAKLGAGDIFGEMSLLTGADRMATVTALSDVDCWRLDRSVFHDLLKRRPEIADEVAAILAHRQVELEEVKEDLTEAAQTARVHKKRDDLAAKIRMFFGLPPGSIAPPSA